MRLADSLSHARRGSLDLRELNLGGTNVNGNGIPSSNSRDRILNVNESPNVASEKRRSVRKEPDGNGMSHSISVNGLNLTPRSTANAISRARDRVPISSIPSSRSGLGTNHNPRMNDIKAKMKELEVSDQKIASNL